MFIALISYLTVGLITICYAFLATILDYYHQYLSKIIPIEQLPTEIDLKSKESLNFEQSKVMQLLLYPIMAAYITTRLFTFSGLSLAHYTIRNLVYQRKYIVNLFNQSFKWLASQIWSLRFLVQIFIRYVVIPIWDLMTPIMEMVIEYFLKFWYQTYQLYLKYSPVIISNFKKFAKSSYAAYLRYSTFLIRWGFGFYQKQIVPFVIKVVEYLKLIYPSIKDSVIQILKFMQRFDLRYRPIIMPYVLQFMDYIERTWTVFYSIVSSPVRLGLFVTRIVKEFVDPALIVFSGLMWNAYSVTSEYCIRVGSLLYRKFLEASKLMLSYLSVALEIGRRHSLQFYESFTEFAKEHRLKEKLILIQQSAYEFMMYAIATSRSYAEMILGLASRLIARAKIEVEIITDAFNRLGHMDKEKDKIEAKFKEFLQESKLTGQGRWEMENLSLEQKKQVLLQQKKPFWKGNFRDSISSLSSQSTQSSRHSTSELSTKFLQLLNKLDYPEEVKAKMLRYAPQQKIDFIAKYEAFQSEKKASYHSASGHLDPSVVLDPRRVSTASRTSSASAPTSAIMEALVSPKSPVMTSTPSKFNPLSKRTSNDRPWVITSSERNSISAYPEKTPMWFTVQIANRNTSMKALYRHLQGLKVCFAESGTKFIHEFITSIVPHIGNNGLSGLAAMEIALDRVCAPYLQKKLKYRPRSARTSALKPLPKTPSSQNATHNWYADQILPDEIRLETMKCIEMVMQSDLGMSSVLTSTGLIRQIIWCLSVPTDDIQVEMITDSRLRTAYLELITIIAEIMGTAALLDVGLKETILRVMHELQRHQAEPYPFFYLVSSLRNPFSFNRNEVSWEVAGGNDPAVLADYYDLWNYRTQLMVFFNGMVSSGDTIPKRARVRTMLESCGLRPILKRLHQEIPTDEFAVQVRAYDQDRMQDLQETSRAYGRQSVDVEKSSKATQELFQSIQGQADPGMMNHFIMSIISNLGEIIKASDQNVKRKMSIGSSNSSEKGDIDIGAVMSLLERSTKSVSESLKNWDLKETDAKNMELLQNNLLNSMHELIGKVHSDKKEKIGAIVEELDSYKQKYAEAKQHQEVLQKDIEFLKMSSMFWTGDQLQSPSVISSIPVIDAENPEPDDSLKREITSLREGSSLDLASAQKLRQRISGFLDDLDLKIEAVEVPILDKVEEGQSTSELSKNISSNVNAEPGEFDTLKYSMPVGKMWEKIKSLEAYVKQLEGERSARRLVEMELEPIDEKDLYAEETSKVVPPAPIPPMMPPAPPVPGVVPKLATDPSLDKIAKAKRAMKALQWEKVPNHIAKNTIWIDIFRKAYEQDLLNEEELLELFAKPDLNVKSSSLAADSATKEAPRTIVRFLDKKNSQNLEIMLNSFKIPHTSIRDAIIRVNDKEMTFDKINRIYALLPTPDIMKQILAYEGPMAELGVAESFLYCIGEIPNLQERLRCMAFRHRFYQEYVEIKPDTLTLISASKEIQRSTRFSQILQVILVIGNYLNGSSFRGNAKGFKLNSILNLKDTKSNKLQKSSTLLHYLVRLLKSKFPETLEFIREMPNVELAERISINSLCDGVKDLAAEFSEVKSQVEQSKEFGSQANDRFMEVFESFCEKTAPKLQLLQENVSIMRKELDAMFLNFGEEGLDRQDEPQEFFGYIVKFSKLITKALKEIEFADAKNAGRFKRPVQQSVNTSDSTMSDQSGTLDSLSTVRPTFMAANPIGEDPMSMLKPVEGMDPFSKRLTVRGGKMPTFEEIQELGEGGAEYSMTSLLLKGNSSLAEARETIQRVRTKRNTLMVEE